MPVRALTDEIHTEIRGERPDRERKAGMSNNNRKQQLFYRIGAIVLAVLMVAGLATVLLYQLL